jgi:hypothetical protein
MCELIDTHKSYELRRCAQYEKLIGSLVRHSEASQTQGPMDVIHQAAEDLSWISELMDVMLRRPRLLDSRSLDELMKGTSFCKVLHE